eukprot:TRINITY_DN19868_c0_g1_i1.p1 TRINITY_DN19868_c0_g1~~TRINITY_DN19868_c0_g1_i1.p1  ORF type:complete len:380 (+),score=76.01 TRINITY_DN19868_c0_g1_i1:69-1208(+)
MGRRLGWAIAFADAVAPPPPAGRAPPAPPPAGAPPPPVPPAGGAPPAPLPAGVPPVGGAPPAPPPAGVPPPPGPGAVPPGATPPEPLPAGVPPPPGGLPGDVGAGGGPDQGAAADGQAQEEAPPEMPPEPPVPKPPPKLEGWMPRQNVDQAMEKIVQAGRFVADYTPPPNPIGPSYASVLRYSGPEELGVRVGQLKNSLQQLKDELEKRLPAERLSAITVEDIADLATPIANSLFEATKAASLLRRRLGNIEEASGALLRGGDGGGGASSSKRGSGAAVNAQVQALDRRLKSLETAVQDTTPKSTFTAKVKELKKELDDVRQQMDGFGGGSSPGGVAAALLLGIPAPRKTAKESCRARSGPLFRSPRSAQCVHQYTLFL